MKKKLQQQLEEEAGNLEEKYNLDNLVLFPISLKNQEDLDIVWASEEADLKTFEILSKMCLSALNRIYDSMIKAVLDSRN